VTVETHMRLSAGMPALLLLTVAALSTADGVRVGRRLRPADIFSGDLSLEGDGIEATPLSGNELIDAYLPTESPTPPPTGVVSQRPADAPQNPADSKPCHCDPLKHFSHFTTCAMVPQPVPHIVVTHTQHKKCHPLAEDYYDCVRVILASL
jgi:hypothetical protein